ERREAPRRHRIEDPRVAIDAAKREREIAQARGGDDHADPERKSPRLRSAGAPPDPVAARTGGDRDPQRERQQRGDDLSRETRHVLGRARGHGRLAKASRPRGRPLIEAPGRGRQGGRDKRQFRAAASVDQPAFLLEHLSRLLVVVGDEGLEVGAGEEAIGLCGAFDVRVPLRRRAHLVEQRDIPGDRVGRDVLRQPQRARLLVLVDRDARILARRHIRPRLGGRDLGARRERLRREHAQRAHLARLPLADALARVVGVGIDVAAGELHRRLAAALERHVEELCAGGGGDEARQRLVGVLRLAAAHLERVGLRLDRRDVRLRIHVRRVALDPQDELVERHRRERREVVALPRELGDLRQQVLVVGAERHAVRVADRRLAVEEPFGAAAATLVEDDDRLLGELVLDDDRLHGAREHVGAAAGAGGDDELDRLARLPRRGGARGQCQRAGAGDGGQEFLHGCSAHRYSSSWTWWCHRAAATPPAGTCRCRRDIAAAKSSAARVAPMFATPLPAISYAVPCAGVVIGNGKPPISVTPRSNPISFIAIWPWSWYIVTTASNAPFRARTNTVSDGNGPSAAMPSARAAATAGAITSISSRPKLPPSPACGLSAATAIRGVAMPASRSDAAVRRIASTTRGPVTCDATAASGMCEVTRAFHKSSRILNSLAGPGSPSTPSE